MTSVRCTKEDLKKDCAKYLTWTPARGKQGTDVANSEIENDGNEVQPQEETEAGHSEADQTEAGQ